MYPVARAAIFFGLLILGWCVWMFFRHPLKSLSLVFKVGFFLLLGLGAYLVLF